MPHLGKKTARLGFAFFSFFLLAALSGPSVGFFAYPIIGLACLCSVLLLLRKPTWILLLIIVFSPLVSYFRDFTVWNLSGTVLTISGVFWLGTAYLCLLSLVFRLRQIRIPPFLVPFLLFTLWTAIRFAITPIGFTGVKDIFFYILPSVIAVFMLVLLRIRKKALLKALEKMFLSSACFPLILYAIFIPSGGIQLTKMGPEGFIDARASAYYLLIVLSISLSAWAYGVGSFEKRRGALFSFLSIGLILFTFSRMASFVAVILFILFLLKPPRLGRLFLGGLLVTFVLLVILLAVPAQQQTIPKDSNAAPIVNLLSSRSSGRTLFWQVTFSHSQEQPIFGWGPGSARIFVAQSITNRKLTEYYPHNEYLQVLHDLGLMGLGLLLLAWIPLFYHWWRQWILEHHRQNPRSAQWSMSAFLSTIVILMTAVTTNTFHYPFIMGPAFIILAAAHGSRDSGGGLRNAYPEAPLTVRAVDSP